jgi:aspartate racemase
MLTGMGLRPSIGRCDMRKIGIVGGIGPESTLDYYKKIIDAFQKQIHVEGSPDIIIYSADLKQLMEMLEVNEWDKIADWLLEKVISLANAGADFAVIGSNTAHLVFDQVASRSPIPLVSIVEETSEKAKRMGLLRPGLLGTRFTMQSDLFQQCFARKGMSIAVPEEKDRMLIHDRLFSEIELGIIKDSTRDELLSIVGNLVEKQGIDSLILGCTELPLILSSTEGYDIPFLNTTTIHVESIVRYCLEE